MFLGVGLDEQLLHGLFQLLVSLPGHTAGIIQAVDIEGGLFKFRLIQIQSLEQHVRLRHSHGREHSFRLQAPILPEHLSVLLVHPRVAGAPPCPLDSALALL